MSQCKFIILNVLVDLEFHLAQEAFNLHTPLDEVARDAMQQHHDNLMSMYHNLKEIRRGSQAQPEAEPREAACDDPCRGAREDGAVGA